MLNPFRFAAALFVILAVTASPALTCLSFMAQMDMQQMACCKHMSDDCDMGAGNQSCCGHASPQTLRASLPDKPVHLEPAIITFHVAAEITQRPQISVHNFIHADDGSPPSETPGSITVLRI